MPYVEAPEQLVPGKPLFYATAFPVSGIANPVLVETHEFRPTKVEGNPDHPASLGSADVPTQASVLGLYDPDRLQTVNFIGEVRSYPSFLENLISVLEKQRAKNGAGIRILTETVTSPTLYAQIQDVLKLYPGAKWYQWEPTGHGAAWAGRWRSASSSIRSTSSIRPMSFWRSTAISSAMAPAASAMRAISRRSAWCAAA